MGSTMKKKYLSKIRKVNVFILNKYLLFIVAISLVFFISCQKRNAPETGEWILASQNKDGGFGLYPGDGSNLISTFSAIQSLKILGYNIPEKTNLARFILSQQNKNGGFKERWISKEHSDTSSLMMTYYALKSLQSINMLPENKNLILNWINSRQYNDGGFLWDHGWRLSKRHREDASLRATYYAILSLQILGHLPNNIEKVKSFLTERQRDTQYKDGSFVIKKNISNTDTPSNNGLVPYTGMGLAILEALNVQPWNKEKTVKYLLGNQQKNGGFSKGLGVYREFDDLKITRMTDTYWAIVGLSCLGEEIKNKELVAAWVKKHLHDDGGYSRLVALCPTDMVATYKAIYILNAIEAEFPSPLVARRPVKDTSRYEIKYYCDQIEEQDHSQIRYLRRISKPIYDKYISDGELKVALMLMNFSADYNLFTSNQKKNSAKILLDGFSTCSPTGRAYIGLANSVDIESRALHVFGHGLAESKINGKWVMIDPILRDYGHDGKGNLKNALEIHQNYLDKGENWTIFGDWRYESFGLEKPNWKI